MAIIQQPDALSLSGNLKKFIVSSGETVSFVLKDGSTVLLDATYEPGADGRVTIDVQDIVESRLSFLITHENFYQQLNVVKTFTAIIDGTEYTFRAIRAGVANLSDTPGNWLKGNFLTWQPTSKPVTYYSPEWLTYYAVEACSIQLKATFPDNTVQNFTLGACEAGKAFTCNVQYAVVAGLLGQVYPSYYEVWAEKTGGTRLTYIQRYLYSEPKSELEQWFLFENSLGGLDTIRAYGDTDFEGAHEHKIASIDGISSEYRIDTQRFYNKNTGYLDEYERRWLLDFFPSRRKFVHFSGAIRPIVVSESDVKYTASDLPSSYNFKYRFADDSATLLNFIRNEDAIPADIVIPDITSPDFILPPRLSEYPRVTLSEGVILPAFDPFTETPKVTTFGAIRDKIISDALSVISAASHSHSNKSIIDQLTQSNLDVLGKLSLVDGFLKIDTSAFATGGLSAYGIGSGGSSGGGVDLLQAWTDYDSTKDNWAVKAGLLVPFYNDTTGRLSALEAGAAMSLSITGTGNAIASISKYGKILTVVKGNFAELDETGKILSSQLPSYVDDVISAASLAGFPVTGETGKIYIAEDTNKTYRWSGTAYVEISASLALGETSSTAYRGDRGKTAYDHSQTEHQTIINGIGFVKANGKALSYDNNSYSLASHNHSGVYEPVLGNPSANGYLLSSTTAGVRSWVAPYSLPTASATVLGGVKIGTNVSIASGVISVHNPVTIGTANGLSLSTQVLSLALATTAANGALSSTDKAYIDLLRTFFEYDSANNAIKALKSLYSTGEISAYGIGSGGSGGGSYDRLDAWADYDSTKSGWVLSALLGVDLNTRVGNLEGGSATTVNTTGTGNAITAISKSGTTITATKGSTFSLDGHTHDYLPLSGGTLTGALTASGGIILPTGVQIKTSSNVEVFRVDATKVVIGVSSFDTRKVVIAGDPIVVQQGFFEYTVYHSGNLLAATQSTAGLLSSVDKTKLDGITTAKQTQWDAAYTHSQTAHQSILNGTGFVKVNGTTVSYDNNSYSLASHNHSGIYEPVLGNPATSGYLLSSTTAGVRSWVAPYSLPTASASVLGGVKIGTNVSIASGVISVHNPVTIGTANGLSLSTQVLSLALATTAANGALSSTDKAYIDLLRTFFEYDSANNAIKALKSLYSTGEISAYGIGSGGSSGGGGVDMLQSWTDYDSTKENWAVKAGLLVPFYNDINSRVQTLENSTPNVSFGTVSEGYVPLTVNSTTYGLALNTHTHSQYLTVITKGQVESVLSGLITTHTHNYIPTTVAYKDIRTITPTSTPVKTMQFGFTSFNINNTYPYGDFIDFGGYQDSSGGRKNLLVVNKSAFGIRQYQASFGDATYGTYVDYYHSGNFNPSDYSLTSHNHNGYYINLVTNGLQLDASKVFGSVSGISTFLTPTGSTNYPNQTGYAVEFNTGVVSSSGYGRDFTLFKTHAQSEWYLRGYNTSGVSTGFKRIWHDGNFNPSNYLPLSGGAMSNTNLVTNLNADLLDGKHASEFEYYKKFELYNTNKGFLKIKFDWGSTSHDMFSTTIRLYQGYHHTDIKISAYNYVTSYWYGPKAELLSSSTYSSLDIRFGYDALNQLFIIVPKENYTQVAISDYVGRYATEFFSNISIEYYATLDVIPGTIQSTVTAYRALRYNENAVSATKLQTARTIWGQSFDGTNNVTGDMAGVTQIANGGVFLRHTAGSNTVLSAESGSIYLRPLGDTNNGSQFIIDNLGNAIASGQLRGTTALLIGLGSNYIPKHTANGLVNSQIFDNGTNVGIGTTTPNERLSLPYGSKIGFTFSDTNSNIYNYISKPITGNSALTFGATYAPPPTDIIFNFIKNGAVTVLAIQQSGNVGIGTTTPSDKLDVKGNIRITNQNEASFYGTLSTSWTAEDAFQIGIAGHKLITTGNHNFGTILKFWTADTERMRIDGSGNVGIGTTTPLYRLDVSGTGRFTGALTAAVSVATPVLNLGNGWTVEAAGSEMHFKLNGVVKGKFIDGAFVSMGELTAYVAAT